MKACARAEGVADLLGAERGQQRAVLAVQHDRARATGVQVGDADEPALGLEPTKKCTRMVSPAFIDQRVCGCGRRRARRWNAAFSSKLLGVSLPDRGHTVYLLVACINVVAAVWRAVLDDRVRVELHLEERLAEQGGRVGVGDGAAPPERRARRPRREPGRPWGALAVQVRSVAEPGSDDTGSSSGSSWPVQPGAYSMLYGVVRMMGDADGSPAAAGAPPPPAARAAVARNRPPVLSANVAANRKRILSRAIRSLLKAADRSLQPLMARSKRS